MCDQFLVIDRVATPEKAKKAPTLRHFNAADEARSSERQIAPDIAVLVSHAGLACAGRAEEQPRGLDGASRDDDRSGFDPQRYSAGRHDPDVRRDAARPVRLDLDSDCVVDKRAPRMVCDPGAVVGLEAAFDPIDAGDADLHFRGIEVGIVDAVKYEIINMGAPDWEIEHAAHMLVLEVKIRGLDREITSVCDVIGNLDARLG
jgi:hypothetical protein